MNKLLTLCRESWLALEPFRAERRRCKHLAYNSDAMSANNLIRQLIKSTVGRYRYLRTGSRVDLEADVRAELDLDAASLEEFLISGMTVNRRRLLPVAGRHEFVNISPEKIFFTRFSEPDGADATLFGMLHDLMPANLLKLFGGASAERTQQLLSHYHGRPGASAMLPCVEALTEFEAPTLPGHLRVIEVWKAISVRTLHCHDLEYAEYFTLPYSDEACSRLNDFNGERKKKGAHPVVTTISVADAWEHTWLTPAGMLLAREQTHPGEFPFVMRLYPMTDGETHSVVADVAPQQMHINRLVKLLDRVIDQSAKGVLLFPTEQLPDGFTWQDLRRIWADPGGIIPYKRTSRSLSPQMVTSSGWNDGAANMLRLQLDLFAEVSGLAPSFRGREAAFAGSEAAKVDSENASIALLDMMAAFHAFVAQRNARATAVIKKGS